MTTKTVCFLGFSWEEMDSLKRAALRIELRLAESGVADLLVINGPSNRDVDGKPYVALVESEVDFHEARLAGAKAAYLKQNDWRETAIILRQAIMNVDMPIPDLGIRASSWYPQ